jgi:polar amino acid transport system substrate-binding protein
MMDQIKAELAPTGVLRAGINMGNFLLVTSQAENGDPAGVSPSMARAIADTLGVPVKYVPFARPGDLADAVDNNVWDIGLIGAEPQRAEKIAFTAAYAEIEATYMVPPGSPITKMEDVDRPGNRIAVTARAAYDLWLERNIHQAKLIRSATLDAAYEQFAAEKLEVLAGLRPKLLSDIEKMPGARILDGKFTAVQQAIGTSRRNSAAAGFLADFVEKAKASGLVARFIAEHKVRGLSVAPPA